MTGNVDFPVFVFFRSATGRTDVQFVPRFSINTNIADQVLSVLALMMREFGMPIAEAATFRAFWFGKPVWLENPQQPISPQYAGRALIAVDEELAPRGPEHFQWLIQTVPAYSRLMPPQSQSSVAGAYSYDLFLSHASEDKDEIARPLYQELISRGVTVWFDEATLELGDSLRRKIDMGLAKCRYGVVILSPTFFAKQWPQRELDGLVARESASGEKAILPIWHRVTHEDVIRYSPPLADRIAGRTSEGIPALVSRILSVLQLNG